MRVLGGLRVTTPPTNLLMLKPKLYKNESKFLKSKLHRNFFWLHLWT